MDNLGKDILPIIAMYLDLPSILKWCETGKLAYKNIYNNTSFWLNKLNKDIPDWKIFVSKSFDISHLHPRESYIFLYQLSLIKKLLNTEYDEESEYDIFLRKRIDSPYKNLTKIPVFNLPNLKELNLFINKLTQIPLLNLPNLRTLSLSNNQLTKFPQLDLPNLRYLSLGNNQIREIPKLNLPKLKFLCLNNNQLREIPQLDLPNLRSLSLTSNQIREIPQLDLPNLRFLYLDDNELTEIPESNFPRLEFLFLLGNKITEKYGKELQEKYKNASITYKEETLEDIVSLFRKELDQ